MRITRLDIAIAAQKASALLYLEAFQAAQLGHRSAAIEFQSRAYLVWGNSRYQLRMHQREMAKS